MFTPIITPQHRINGGKVMAALKRPYLAPALHAMTLIETREVDTLAVDKFWRCYYNPDLIEKYPTPFIAGMLTHEVNHLIRNHAARGDRLIDGDHFKWNCAGDLEINDDICEEKENDYATAPMTPLPDFALLPAKFNFDNGLLAETYYRLLDDLKGKRNGDGKGTGKGKGQSDKGQISNGECGSAAGGGARPYELPAPDGGSQSEGITEQEGELIRQRVATEVNRIAQSAEGRGKMPAGLLRWAEEYLTPRVNFTKWVRALLKNAYAEASGHGERTYRRAMRRQHAYGSFIMPGSLQPRVRVGFIIDTSGSMSDTQLGQCMAELRGFASSCAHTADLYALSCDAQATTPQRIQTPKNIELFGGGGTDMTIGFNVFAEMRPRIDLIVCITDCYTPWPAHKPKATTVIVQVGEGCLPSWPCHYVHVTPEKR
jgi:predicted metal-dependent peptidase